MKIAFLMNKFDRTNISKYPRGHGYYVVKAFEKCGAEVKAIPPAVTGEFPHKVRHTIYKYVLGQSHLRYADLSLLRREAKIRNKTIEDFGADIIFSFGPFASFFLETDRKIAFWSDLCLSLLLNNPYPYYRNLTSRSINNYRYIEQKGLDVASAAFYSTNWVKKEVVKNNSVDENKLFIAPYGANLDVEHGIDFIEKITKKRIENKICKLVLIGVNWKLKGADIAISIVKRLNERGFKSELTIIGCQPDSDTKTILPNFIKVMGYINSAEKDGKNRIHDHYKESNFFLMPTLSESFGHVFCEANAFGLPAISHKVDGVSEVILNGKNGQLFEIGENIDHWCEYIIKTFENKNTYKELCLSSFNESQTRLNWDVGAKIVIDKLKTLL